MIAPVRTKSVGIDPDRYPAFRKTYGPLVQRYTTVQANDRHRRTQHPPTPVSMNGKSSESPPPSITTETTTTTARSVAPSPTQLKPNHSEAVTSSAQEHYWSTVTSSPQTKIPRRLHHARGTSAGEVADLSYDADGVG
ncbi:hypothetical protein GCM10009619_42260 [Williamsia maris]